MGVGVGGTEERGAPHRSGRRQGLRLEVGELVDGAPDGGARACWLWVTKRRGQDGPRGARRPAGGSQGGP